MAKSNQQEIKVHPLTENPQSAWKELFQEKSWINSLASKIGLSKLFKNKHQVIEMDPSTLQKNYPNENTIRVVCVSDTHSQTYRMEYEIPDGDILIHAGDFSLSGRLIEVKLFNEWLGTLPHKHKVVIAGNHDMSFDPNPDKETQNYFHGKYSKFLPADIDEDEENDLSPAEMKKFLSNCIYLEDSSVSLYGLKIYGAPWIPGFEDKHKVHFGVPRGEGILEKWNQIPNDTDILITHGPPLGYGDFTKGNVRVGCVELLSTVQSRVKPKYHIYGHVHEGYGVRTNGETVFINPAICQSHDLPVNKPIFFDIELPKLPKGFVFQEFQPVH